MCCRVFPIPEADKPNTDWCANLQIGKGCRIYERRPEPCRAFHCLWLLDDSLGEEWRPDIAGFVLSDPDPWALLVTNDPDNPQAWRREPFEARIRTWAEVASARGIFAGVREAQILLLLVGADERIIEGA
jgi:hypothetical protein